MSRKIKNPGRRSRTKGHQFERDIAIELRPIFPDSRRHLEYHSRDANGVDLVETGRLKIQCKKLKKYAPLTAIKQIKCARDLGDVPVLITAGDNQEPLAALPLSDFIELLRQSQMGYGSV